MEQPCYKCGQLVEEGRVFCPHCVAPQIRVVVAEPPPVPAAYPIQAPALPASESVPLLAVPMTWSQAVKPAALAAIVGTILIALRLYPFVAILVMGFLASLFFRQGRPAGFIKASVGFRLGALSGLFSAGFMALFTAVGTLLPDVRDKLHEQTIEYFQQAAASQPDNPQVKVLLDQLKTPEGYLALMILFGVLLIFVSILLGGLGGAIGAAILSRREKS